MDQKQIIEAARNANLLDTIQNVKSTLMKYGREDGRYHHDDVMRLERIQATIIDTNAPTETHSLDEALASLERDVLGMELPDEPWYEWNDLVERAQYHNTKWPMSTTSDMLLNLIILRLRIVGKKIDASDEYHVHECPVCEEDISHLSDRYKCRNCGTKLTWYNDEKETETKILEAKMTKSIKKYVKLGITLVILLLLIGFGSQCVKFIPTGYTGVRVTLQKVEQNPVRTSPTFIFPLTQNIQLVNNKQQTTTHNERIWGESRDQTVVYMENVSITYQINPEWSVWLYSNVTDYANNTLPANVIQSSMKSAMQTLETDKVTKRDQVEPLATEKLQAAINRKYEGNEVVTIVSVNINNIDFEEEYNKAIAARQNAQVVYEQQQIDIKTQLEKAEADKKEREIQADADAIEKKKAAEAEAEAIKKKAEAQAEANKKLAESLSQTLIDYEKIQKWNGQMPTVQGGTPFIEVSP